MSCGVGCRSSSDPVLLWLWRKPVAIAPIRPLAWEPPYATNAALNGKEKKKKTNQELGSLGVPLVAQRGKDPALSLLWLSYYCGAGSIPGPGTSTHSGYSRKRKRTWEFKVPPVSQHRRLPGLISLSLKFHTDKLKASKVHTVQHQERCVTMAFLERLQQKQQRE